MRHPSSALRILVPMLALACASSLNLRAKPAAALSIDEGFANPLGFHDPSPTFSWQLPQETKHQSAYRLRLQIAEGESWDSGWVDSEQSTLVPYKGPRLRSRDRVTWQVNFRDDAGQSGGWSKAAYFELGLLSAEDWTARWIRPKDALPPQSEPVANLRRSFQLSKQVIRARLHVTARGLFSVEINGNRVGEDHFANGFTPYRKRIDTLTYDVTKLLHSGYNEIDALLGTGWYAGRFPFDAKTSGCYGRDVALLAQLEITYRDGSSDTIGTDGKWEYSWDGPIISSSLYDGETYDARRKVVNWKPVLVEADLGKAHLQPKSFEPVRAVASLPAKMFAEPQPGRFVFDLGQNMVGWARLRIPVEKNRTITVRFAEMLKDDGTLYTDAYRSAKSTDTYTAAQNGVIDWQPHFTFHGFRYVELSGLPAGVVPQRSWVEGVVLQSALSTGSSFNSSHAKLNQLHSNIVWGWRSNSLDIPTDCPQRDERLGWTGDAQVFCPTSLSITKSHAFWKAWLRSMREEQDANGVIPNVIPDAIPGQWRECSPGWMDAAVSIPWDVYVRTGDTGILEDNFEMMEKLVAWYRSQSANGLLPGIKGFGDWLQPYTVTKPAPGDWMGTRMGDTPRQLIGAAFYARNTQLLSEIAGILKRERDAQRYGEEAQVLRTAFAKQYFDAEGRLQNATETQTAYLLALAFKLLPADLEPKAASHLAQLVKEAGVHLRTGFLGTPFLTTVLDQFGYSDLAASLLFQESYPSWFYSINQGATTMWERWNSYTRDQGFGDVEMNSFNHYAYGAIGQWLYERIAGITPDAAKPGYKHFFVRPLVVPQLDSAKAEVETPYGKVLSSWRKQGQKVEVDIVVPANTSATVELPDGSPFKTVFAGTHHFDCNLPLKSLH